MNKIDFEQDQIETVDNNDATQIGDLCQQLVDMEAEVAALKELLKQDSLGRRCRALFPAGCHRSAALGERL